MTPAEAARRTAHEVGKGITYADPLKQEVLVVLAASWEMYAAFLEGQIT